MHNYRDNKRKIINVILQNIILPFFLVSFLGFSSTGGMNACSRLAFLFSSAATCRAY